jgi:hypothetical protein
MGEFPYICEKCGGGDERCCSDMCEEEDCGGGQFCWSSSAVCVIDDIRLNREVMSKEEMEMLQGLYDKWKGKPLYMEYNGGASFTCQRFPGIDFAVDCNGIEWEDYGIHVKAWCEQCWDGDDVE